MKNYTIDFANEVIKQAKETNHRLGQALFNELPTSLANLITGTKFDVYYADEAQFNATDLYVYCVDHLIMDEHGVKAFLNDTTIIWSRNYDR